MPLGAKHPRKCQKAPTFRARRLLKPNVAATFRTRRLLKPNVAATFRPRRPPRPNAAATFRCRRILWLNAAATFRPRRLLKPNVAATFRCRRLPRLNAAATFRCRRLLWLNAAATFRTRRLLKPNAAATFRMRRLLRPNAAATFPCRILALRPLPFALCAVRPVSFSPGLPISKCGKSSSLAATAQRRRVPGAKKSVSSFMARARLVEVRLRNAWRIPNRPFFGKRDFSALGARPRGGPYQGPQAGTWPVPLPAPPAAAARFPPRLVMIAPAK